MNAAENKLRLSESITKEVIPAYCGYPHTSRRVTIAHMDSPTSLKPDKHRLPWLLALPKLGIVLLMAALIALLWLLQQSEREEQRNILIKDVLWLEQNLRFHLLLRPDEVLSGILHASVLEVAHNALGVLLQHRHMGTGCFA